MFHYEQNTFSGINRLVFSFSIFPSVFNLQLSPQVTHSHKRPLNQWVSGSVAFARLWDSIVGRVLLGKGGGGGSPRAFFVFLFTEQLFTTISEPRTGYRLRGEWSMMETDEFHSRGYLFKIIRLCQGSWSLDFFYFLGPCSFH